MKEELEGEVIKAYRMLEKYEKFIKAQGLDIDGVEMKDIKKSGQDDAD